MLLAAPAAVLSAVFLFASVDARFCSSATFGELNGRSLQLQPISLPDKNNKLYIGDSCYTLGPYFRTVGFKITACDRWKPLVIADNIDHAWVGLVETSRSAVARITQFCGRIPYGGDSEVDEAVPYVAADSAPSDQYDD